MRILLMHQDRIYLSDIMFGDDLDNCSECREKGKFRKGRTCYQVVAEKTGELGEVVRVAFATRLCGYCYPIVCRKLESSTQPPLRMASKKFQREIDEDEQEEFLL